MDDRQSAYLTKLEKFLLLLTRNDQRKRRRATVSSTTMRFVEESLLRRIKKTQEIQRKDNKEIEKSRELASSRGMKTWGRRRRRRSVKCNPFALDCLGICVLFMLRAPYSVLSSGSWCSFSLSQQLLGERRKGEKLNQDRVLFLY